MSENTDKNQKGAPGYAEEMRYVGVQMEQMNESFKFVTEMVIKTNEKLDDLISEVRGELKNKVDVPVFNSLVDRVEKIEA